MHGWHLKQNLVKIYHQSLRKLPSSCVMHWLPRILTLIQIYSEKRSRRLVNCWLRTLVRMSPTHLLMSVISWQMLSMLASLRHHLSLALWRHLSSYLMVILMVAGRHSRMVLRVLMRILMTSHLNYRMLPQLFVT